ncbi:hypothetical protein CR970_04600 [Candidatus Saccharibacteria bacterium]|nr:MAG: hypothetical protein CR970_04600 [Candidatus Saccharibacteria bacterium]
MKQAPRSPLLLAVNTKAWSLMIIPFAVVGAILIARSLAATFVMSAEVESGALQGAVVQSDNAASGGAAVRFAGGGSGTGDYTGGSGGERSDLLFQSFSARGMTSNYHVFAADLDWSKDVGMLLWADGSGGYGFDNPNDDYLLDADGGNGMVNVAKQNNMLLLIPEAPPPGCDDDDNCWYNESSSPNAVDKAHWANDLVQHVYGLYNIDKSRVAIGGYSSGAQFTSRWFVPLHGVEAQTDGVFVPVAYGGAPANGSSFTQAYRDAVVGYWNTGTSDSAYSDAEWGAIAGYNWYRDNGFTVDYDWPEGVGHDRDGEFDDIMAAQIATHVRPH